MKVGGESGEIAPRHWNGTRRVGESSHGRPHKRRDDDHHETSLNLIYGLAWAGRGWGCDVNGPKERREDALTFLVCLVDISI